MRTFMLFTMLFAHIVDDFYLQGPLADMKQIRWWNKMFHKQANEDVKELVRLENLYRYDFLIALFLHGFSWTFMVMSVPMMVMIFSNHPHIVAYIVAFVINWFIHIVVDNFKCNYRTINLVADQTVHIVQVILTWLTFFIFIDIYVR